MYLAISSLRPAGAVPDGRTGRRRSVGGHEQDLRASHESLVREANA